MVTKAPSAGFNSFGVETAPVTWPLSRRNHVSVDTHVSVVHKSMKGASGSFEVFATFVGTVELNLLPRVVKEIINLRGAGC